MISSRYAVPVIILLVVALIPTIIHNYLGATVIDGKSVHAIPGIFNNFRSKPSKRNSQWGQETFGSDDWFERDYFDTQRTKVRLFVARSYDHKRLYHHPELAISYGQNLTEKSISTIAGHPRIPVHILTNDNKSKLVAYTLLYDNEFIKSPIMHQLRDSARLLVNARKPMTLFYTSQLGLPHNAKFDQSAAALILSLAIKDFQSQSAITEHQK